MSPEMILTYTTLCCGVIFVFLSGVLLGAARIMRAWDAQTGTPYLFGNVSYSSAAIAMSVVLLFGGLAFTASFFYR